MDSFLTKESSEEDFRYLLRVQREKYREIKRKSSGKIQAITAVLSLVVSFGVFQILTSRGITSAPIDIPVEFANRCAPAAIQFSDPVLRGMGKTNSSVGLALALLGLYFIAEIVIANHRIQNLPDLRPRTELEIRTNGYRANLEANETVIQQADAYLAVINHRIQYLFITEGIAGTILLLVYNGIGMPLIMLDLLLVVAALILLGVWSKEYIDQGSLSQIFKLNSDTPTVGFPVFLVVLWAFFALHVLQSVIILERLMIC